MRFFTCSETLYKPEREEGETENNVNEASRVVMLSSGLEDLQGMDGRISVRSPSTDSRWPSGSALQMFKPGRII